MLDESHGDGGGDFIIVASGGGGLRGRLGLLLFRFGHQIGVFRADFGTDVRADNQNKQEHERGSHAHDQKDETA